MSLISRDELRVLAETRTEWCVSIYMPTHKAGPEIQQNSIRLKNLIGQAEVRLEAYGMQAPEIATLLSPANDLLPNRPFWQHQSDGLAIFLSPDTFRVYRLPLKFQALALIAQRFHLKPLLPVLSADGYFYLLTLSQDEIRLFRGTQYSISELELQDVPDGLAEFLKDRERERHLQFHTSTRVPGGRGSTRPAIFHGHGVIENHKKKDILHYFQQVGAGLHMVLGEASAPLVLAGVDYLLPIYRQANTYPHLAEVEIESHPQALDLEQLHARAWVIVQPLFTAAQREARAHYLHLAGTDDVHASHMVDAIVPAAYFARVETLFVALGSQCWGIFDPQMQNVEVHNKWQPGDEDLLDLAAVHTFLNHGAVYAVPLQDIPAAGRIAAILRY